MRTARRVAQDISRVKVDNIRRPQICPTTCHPKSSRVLVLYQASNHPMDRRIYCSNQTSWPMRTLKTSHYIHKHRQVLATTKHSSRGQTIKSSRQISPTNIMALVLFQSQLQIICLRRAQGKSVIRSRYKLGCWRVRQESRQNESIKKWCRMSRVRALKLTNNNNQLLQK